MASSSVGTEWCRWMRLIDLKSVPFSFIRNCFLLIPRVIKLAIATGVEIIHLFSSCFSTAAFNDDTLSSLFRLYQWSTCWLSRHRDEYAKAWARKGRILMINSKHIMCPPHWSKLWTFNYVLPSSPPQIVESHSCSNRPCYPYPRSSTVFQRPSQLSWKWIPR